MKVVAILSQKGGTGKTTVSLHLAVAAERRAKSVAVIDLDPQASSAGWKDSRASDTPVVVSIPHTRLAQALQTAEEAGADLALIDTAPHSEAAAVAAAKAADLVLIPCRPGILDLRGNRQDGRAGDVGGEARLYCAQCHAAGGHQHYRRRASGRCCSRH